MVAKAEEPSCYRLRGAVSEVERFFLLAPGENRLGSAEDNTIVIPTPGVSRHHARLEVGPEGLLLEDLNSRNGTAVDGTRIDCSTVQPGEEIRLGPVTLKLEALDAGDTRLGLILEPESATAAAAAGPQESTEILSDSPAGAGELSALAPLERFLDGIASEGMTLRLAGDLNAAMGVLARQLDGSAALVEWQRSQGAVVAAAHGDTGPYLSDPVFHDLREKVERRSATGPCCRSVQSREPSTRAYAILGRPGASPLCLVVVAGEPPSPATLAGLRLLVRLLDPGRVAPEAARRPDAQPTELVFPENWAPCHSPAMLRLYEDMRPLLTTDLPVLIEGETGVGKEQIARILHASSHHRRGPFVAINCAAVPADLLEAEMFGIGDGVATGVRGRAGRFQQAADGTLLLDEVGDMSAALQAKLLRALQEKEIHPVGRPAVAVDVRVVAATNCDLSERVEADAFRRDLYYRIAGCVLRVPPLRERREEIPSLVEHFLRAAARGREGDAGKTLRGLTVKALEHLLDYPWPGNVRELEHEIRRLAHLCPPGLAIDSTMLADRVRRAPDHQDRERPEASAALPPPPRSAPAPATLELAVLERETIEEALRRSGGNQVRAAELLGISRHRLRRRMERYQLGGPPQAT
ncbi:MAG: FHA domain-containing protein [bacterium]|nr:FHA domain-containing protein [bacterium]